ncbi:MAG: hypothetical protein GY809_21045 [Planctomycetes bacterium]|nr:hypothetical protein [Planctomycetota bacterium]
MVKTIGDIDFMNPGYKKLWIRPQPGGKITSAGVHYDSIRGRIGSEWALKNGTFEFTSKGVKGVEMVQ